ncbi:hypothetical protein BKA83DRAFT_648805 [Pisolithus microcarpus]|nr:hypothetical protein BKA83DRAFT_648805 [Pisolithus microcarpus]
MVKTRRKSKAVAAAAAAAAAVSGASNEDHDGASTQGTEDISISAGRLSIPIPVDVDIEALSSIIPQVSFTNPTPDTIVSVYRLLLAQVAETHATHRDIEELRAEVERKDIELDQAVQDGETKSKDLETSLEAAQSKLSALKSERDELVESNNTLQAKIASLATSRNTSSTELDHLRHRIDECEKEKRDLIGVVSRLKEDASQRDGNANYLISFIRSCPFSSYRGNPNSSHQPSTGKARTAGFGFKIETLSQQLGLAKDETARVTTELTSKSEEYARYRRTKHAEFVQLQTAHDAMTQKHASVESSLKAIQSAHEVQTQQLTQALARVQDFQGKLAEQEAAFSTEVSGLKRLVTIMEEREKQAKGIVESIEREWAGVGDRAEKREAALRAEAEKERRTREEVEKRLEQLEIVLERINRGELPTAGRGASVSGRGQDVAADAMFGLSPTVAMVSRVQRGGKTFTEVYADYVRLEEDYAKKCAEYDHMDRTLSEVLAQIEERAPILAQQREEYERLQREATQLSAQLSIAISERDANASSIQDLSQKIKKAHAEKDVLQHQLTDLGRQVQMLLKELGRHDDPSIPSDEILDQMDPIPANDIEAVITNNLVLFRSIPELQEQNQRLLKVVREMGAKMEAEERDYRAALEQEQCEAVREAHEAIQELVTQLERQKKSSEMTIQAYMKERDTLKAMLARPGRAVSHVGLNGDAGTNGTGVGAAVGSSTQPSDDLAMELADVQSQFDSYRQEMGVDSSRLREDLVNAQREVGRANADLAKANAKIQYLDERHRMTHEQLALQSRDLDKLTIRNQQLYDQQIRLDIDKERVMDELAMAKSDLEQLRNEAANLRAEKKIWESVQTRLIEDNKALSVERAQLADLVANVQRIHGDLERSGENDRKRLETQIQMMESQTQELKVQLSRERDTIRHLTLQRDIDMKDLQARLDKTTEQLAQARESLVGAETSKTHLQDRVEQLTRQLQGNEEKLAVYERRVSGTSTVTTAPSPDLPREQQLEQEVAELRSALKVAQVDLASARTHMQQFQEISQANEAALAALNATHDQYKADAEAQTTRLESEYRSLQEKLRSVEDELEQANAKVAEIQQTLERERTEWINDKKILEGTIVELSTSERSSESDRAAHEREIRELEQRAIVVEERYTREVVAHAESLKNVENLRQQLATAQATARHNLSEAATTQAKLEASEGSWKQQKEALEKEIADLNARYDDLSAQKALLYQHLDTISSQAARIRQVADSSTENAPDAADGDSDSDAKLAELRAEKEIVDLQLELCKQENVRLKGQIDHLNRSLQETRNTLSEERERTIQAATSDVQHAEMLERINQLNILRESNATLRADCETYAKRARELDAKLKTLSAELEPTKEVARVARAELQARDAQIALLEGESKRWQERNSQLLSKYDRIDPAEVQSLKDEIAALKSQKAEVEKVVAERDAKLSEGNARVEALEDALRKHKEAATKNTESFRQRLGQVNQERSRMNQQVKELQEQVKTLTAERDTLRAGASVSADSGASNELNAQIDTLRHEKATLERALAEEKAKPSQSASSPDQTALIASLQAERDRLLAEKEAPSDAGGSDASKSQWADERAELSKARDEAVARAKVRTPFWSVYRKLRSGFQTSDEEARKAADDARNLKQANEKFQVRIQDLQRARDRANTELAAAVEKAKGEMSTVNAGNTEELVKKHAKELEDLRALLNAQYEANLKAAVDAATLAAKAEAAVASNDDATKAAVDAAIAAREREFQTKLNDEIEKAVERGRMEQGAKSKLKDAQLVRSQLKVKELEAQILEWRKAGIVPDSTNTPATTTTPATTATPAASTTESSTTPATSAGPVRKQATSGAVTLGPTEVAIRGRGRGFSIRGAQRGMSIRGRGGAPSPAAPTAPPQQQEVIQIMGAASKRAREDDASSDDSLAKRIKPAEAATSTPGPAGGSVANKPPVTIRRPQPPA